MSNDKEEFQGKVVETLPNGFFKIVLDNGQKLTAYLSGKMRQNNINVLRGDRVVVAVSKYDSTKGILIYRL